MTPKISFEKSENKTIFDPILGHLEINYMSELVAEELDGIELEAIHWQLRMMSPTDYVIAFVDYGKLCIWVDGFCHEINPYSIIQIDVNKQISVEHTTFGGDYWHLKANFQTYSFTINVQGEPYCTGLVFPFK